MLILLYEFMQLIIEESNENRQEKLYQYFLFLCFAGLALAWLGKYVLISDNLFFDHFGEQLAYDRIDELILMSKKWEWLGYVMIPFIYLIKIFFVACCLSAGILISNIKVPFRSLLYITVLSELFFLLVPVVKIFWFGVFFTDYTFQDLQTFSPLSVLSLIGTDSVELFLVYPLSLINLFEFFYWVLLAFGLVSITKAKFMKMFGLVASSYGVGLLLWVLVVVFLTVNAS